MSKSLNRIITRSAAVLSDVNPEPLEEIASSSGGTAKFEAATTVHAAIPHTEVAAAVDGGACTEKAVNKLVPINHHFISGPKYAIPDGYQIGHECRFYVELRPGRESWLVGPIAPRN